MLQVHAFASRVTAAQHVAFRVLGALQAYDQHLNMILGEVEETITTVEIDDETYEEIIKVRRC